MGLTPSQLVESVLGLAANGKLAADVDPLRFPKHHAFIHDSCPHVAMVGGIGSGKSYSGVVRALRASAGLVGSTRIPTPNLGMITAPSYPMLRDTTQRTFFELAGGKVREFYKAENRVLMTNGSEILFRSADKFEYLRGTNLAWWFGDEAALYDAGVRKIMIGRLRQFGEQGYEWLATTPRGRNWVWQEFVQRERPDYALHKIRTSDNPSLSLEFLEGLKLAYTGDFAAQELEGEFVSFEGLIYAEFHRDVHVITLPATQRFVSYAAGVDWGYANPGVIVVGGVDGDGRVTIIHEEYQRGLRIEEWAAIASQLFQQYRIQTYFCDPSEPDFIEAFVQKSLNAQAAVNDVLPGIQTVKSYLAVQGDGQPRLQMDRSCVNLIAEFESYVWMERRGEGIYDKPRKAHDHLVDALRYLLVGIALEGDSNVLGGALSHSGVSLGTISNSPY